MSTDTNYSPYDPTGTTWNVVVFENETVSPDSGARWTFNANQTMTDRGLWNGHWTFIPGSDNRIRTYTAFPEKEFSVDEIVFLNKDRFIAMHDNKIFRLGRRI